MSSDWFYMRSGKIVGPLASQQLRERAINGDVTPTDYIRRGNDGKWVAAANVKGLFDQPAGPPPTASQFTRHAPTPSVSSDDGQAEPVTVAYKVLTQKDKWLSSKFDPETLEKALNAYASQGWRVRTGDTASFPGLLTGFREEMITILEREEGVDNMDLYEYKVLTQKDKWYSGKFDPERLEGALNAYAEQGWKVVFGTTASFPGFFSSNRDELIVVLSRRRS